MLSLQPRMNPAAPHAAAEEILRIVLRHGNTVDGGELGNSFGHHLPVVERAVARQETLELVLPAFPAKSPNPEKTISPLPDYAEVLGLERLQRTCDAIGRIHAPGARVVICSDGRVFSDLVLVSDEHVSAYARALRAMMAELGLPGLSTMSMEDVYGGQDFGRMRESLERDHARPLAAVRADVLAHIDARLMFNGIHRFLFEDRLALSAGASRSRVREEAKHVAYEVIRRSNAWSSLVESLFPHALRLSIHPQLAKSRKLGFRLVDCEDTWGTPWHNVALETPRGPRLVKRREAEARGAHSVRVRGRYAAYREAP